jgi:hypothetical protein
VEAGEELRGVLPLGGFIVSDVGNAPSFAIAIRTPQFEHLTSKLCPGYVCCTHCSGSWGLASIAALRWRQRGGRYIALTRWSVPIVAAHCKSLRFTATLCNASRSFWTLFHGMRALSWKRLRHANELVRGYHTSDSEHHWRHSTRWKCIFGAQGRQKGSARRKILQVKSSKYSSLSHRLLRRRMGPTTYHLAARALQPHFEHHHLSSTPTCLRSTSTPSLFLLRQPETRANAAGLPPCV